MLMEHARLFESHRKTLEGIAYRMLGSLAEASEIVQETYIKWHQQDIGAIDNPRSWLITVCTRLSMNQLKLAYKQREDYIGEWLPEPLVEDFSDPLHAQLEFNESLSMALLRVLEMLSPTERAVFLLYDVFELSFSEIADTVHKTPAACRQLASRARKHIRENRPRFNATPDEHRTLLHQFGTALKTCDFNELVSIFAEDIEVYSDGGGKVSALPKVMHGHLSAARFLFKVYSDFQKQNIEIDIVPQRFNGSLGMLIYENKVLSTTLMVECTYGKICRIYAVRNPDKLGKVETLSSVPET